MQKRLKKFNTLIKYLVATIILVVPLYPKFPFMRIPGTFVAIRLEDFVLVFSAIILLIIIYPNIREFFKDRINKAILIFLLVGLTSLFSALLITKTVTPHIGILHWIRRVEYFLPFFVGLYAIKPKRTNLDFYLNILIVAFILTFFYGLGQRYLNWPIIVTQNEEYARGVALRYIPGSHINSTFAGHYDLGTFLVFLLPVFISLFFLIKKLREKFLLLLVVTGGLWLLANSGSRVSTFSYIIAVTSALVVIRKFKAIPAVLIFSLLIFSTSSNLVARYRRIIEVTTDKLEGLNRLLYIQDNGLIYAQESFSINLEKRKIATPTPTPIPVFEDRSTSIRLNVEWPRALRAFSKSPLLGTGYSSITLATDNDYLRLLGEVGVLGFLAFLLIFIRIGEVIFLSFPLYKNFKGIELGYFSGILGGTFGVFMNAIFLDVFEASKFATIFWLFTGILVSLVKTKRHE